ncbi:MAG TPA: type IV secretory system conjugative DNA transfer family protein [Longimicrobium sp.]|nr:type IV secretory system conjugative DNA transfer family protein [Longimicrobium sp.]
MPRDPEGALSRPQDFLLVRQRGLGIGPLEVAMLAAFCAMCGLGVATQVVADGFGYHRNLGPALYAPEAFTPVEAWTAAAASVAMVVAAAWTRRGKVAVIAAVALAAVSLAAARGPLYMPTEFVRWLQDYRSVPAAQPILARGWLGFLGGSLICGAGVAASLHGARRKAVSVSHGSARWGSGDDFAITPDEVREMETAAKEGRPFSIDALVLGRHRDGRLLLFRGEGHLATAAASQTGKTIGVVVPNVLLYKGGLVISDVKGTIFFMTHRKRTELGNRVVVLDPFLETVNLPGVEAVSAPFLHGSNPLSIIRTDREDALDEARMLASMIIPDEEGPNRHFSDEAKAFCTGLILHVCWLFSHEPERRTLTHMRRMVAQDEKGFADLLSEMATSPYRYVREAVAELKQKETRELSGTLSTFHRSTRFLSSPAMERVLGHGPKMFDPLTLKAGNVTLYLVIPPNRLTDYQSWLRLMIGCLTSVIARSEIERPYPPVQAMVDEMGQLGYLEPIERAVTLMTEYGLRVWMIVQDFNQLKKNFPKSHETLLGATAIRTVFGTGDVSTAEMISKYAGEATIFAESGNLGQSRGPRKAGSGGLSLSSGESTSEKGRKLITIDEVLRLGPEQQVILPRGGSPILATKVRHYTAPELVDQFDENPLRGK